jgi:hypothetical protein
VGDDSKGSLKRVAAFQIPFLTGALFPGWVSAVDMDVFFGELALFAAIVSFSCLGGHGALSQMQTPRWQRLASARSSRDMAASRASKVQQMRT